MDSLKTLSFIECIKNENIYNKFLNLPKYTQNVLSKDYILFTNIKIILQKYNLCEKYLSGIKDFELSRFFYFGLIIEIRDHPRTITQNYIRNLRKLDLLTYMHWDYIWQYLTFPVTFYEEFSSEVSWDNLFCYGKIPKNKVAYLLKKYQKEIKHSFLMTTELLMENGLMDYDDIRFQTRYFLNTGIITYDDYDFLDHIEDTSEIFIFKQLSQP